MVKWYYSLYGEEKGLFGSYERQDIRYPRLLVSSTHDMEKGKRKFALFEDLNDFEAVLGDTKTYNRNFYEVILGEVRQKPHFDIDNITLKDVEDLEQTVDEIVKATERAFQMLGIEPEELRWYESNGKDKKSLHMVIPGYYVKNNNEAKRIYYYLKEIIPDYLFRFFDHMVYSALQNFRILGNCKSKSDRRYKNLLFREETDDSLEESLITSFNKNMKEFPYLDVQMEEDYIANDFSIEDECMNEAISKVLDYLGSSFRLYGVKNSFMSFERLRSSQCSICQVQHDSIFPFARISKNGKVYLYCYRSRLYCHANQEQRKEIFDFGWSSEWIGSLDDDLFMEKKSELKVSSTPTIKEVYNDYNVYQESLRVNPKIENNKMLSNYLKGKNNKKKNK